MNSFAARIYSLNVFLIEHKQSGRKAIFVVGMPRSGTTFAERIIASIPGVHDLGNFPPS